MFSSASCCSIPSHSACPGSSAAPPALGAAASLLPLAPPPPAMEWVAGGAAGDAAVALGPFGTIALVGTALGPVGTIALVGTALGPVGTIGLVGTALGPVGTIGLVGTALGPAAAAFLRAFFCRFSIAAVASSRSQPLSRSTCSAGSSSHCVVFLSLLSFETNGCHITMSVKQAAGSQVLSSGG